LKLPKSTATRQVDYLVKKALANRTIPDNNRRTVELTLTDKGKELYSWFQGHLVNVMTAVRQEYSEQELDMMISLLPRVIAHSEAFLRETGHWR
jgi:DNA-binding MarR family transcriptional regulator